MVEGSDSGGSPSSPWSGADGGRYCWKRPPLPVGGGGEFAFVVW